MKHVCTLLWLGLWLTCGSVIAQPNATKVYVAKVGKEEPSKGSPLKRRNDQILFEVKSQINNLFNLLNTLTSNETTEAESDAIIKNSYLPNSNQLFYSDGIVVEDDVDPNHVSSENPVDHAVEKYLRDIELFYTKTPDESIKFSQVITSPVLDGKDYLYVKVFFRQTFGSKHKQIDAPYRPVQRVAELRAERQDNKWRVFITRLAFPQPGEGLTELTKPVIPKDFGPEKPIKGKAYSFRGIDRPSDSLSIKSDAKWLQVLQSSAEGVPVGLYQRNSGASQSRNTISISLTEADQQLTFRRVDGTTIGFAQLILPGHRRPDLGRRYRTLGWVQVAVGTLALGLSYAGYASLQNDYKQYTNQLTALNNEYAIWQTLTQQPSENPVAAMSFSSYARPGVYAVYGGSVAGSGLLINGIRYLLKARQIKKQRGR